MAGPVITAVAVAVPPAERGQQPVGRVHPTAGKTMTNHGPRADHPQIQTQARTTAARAASAIPVPGIAADSGPAHSMWPLPSGDEYQLADIYFVTARDVDAIRAAAVRAWEIVRAVAPIARALPDNMLDEFGIPETAREIVRSIDDAAPETLIGRFDFIATADGYRVIEFNAETPYFIIESHHVSGCVARAAGYDDPNAGCEERLGRTIANAIGAHTPDVRVVVTAHDAAAEDRATAHYLLSRIAESSIATVGYAPLVSLRVRDDGLYDSGGRIDVLYRLYPLEHLARDRVAPQVFDLVRRGALRLLNPPSALIAQSKMLMVLIWGLAARADVLSPAQCAVVHRTFLPTFADLPSDGKTYVRKCVLGREGASVAIIHPDGTTIESLVRRYDAQPCIFQEYREMPRWNARTPGGRPVDGRVLTTCFIAAGEAGAIGIRIGGEITDSRAYFAAVGMTSTMDDAAIANG